jgi:hypothetical protein
VNEILRRALLNAHLNEVDVAARLEVDPKTVRRWLEGRLPYSRHRWALAGLLNLNETDLWPELHRAQTRPAELLAIYPHRSSIPRDTWRNLFASAKHEIGILDISSLFLAEDSAIIRVLAQRMEAGVRIRIALHDPNGKRDSRLQAREDVKSTEATDVLTALKLYHVLQDKQGIAFRFHRSTLYNSIYRADNELLVNQHAYGVPASDGPVLHLRLHSLSSMAAPYFRSFESLWNTARPRPDQPEVKTRRR